MTDDLHDVLDRTADLAGTAHFDADALWRQGARTQRVHTAMTVVGVLAVLALVSLSVWWGTGTTTPRPAAPATTRVTPAMPSTLYGVPADVRPTSPRLDIGPVAAAFSSELGSTVAVSAIDGSYHVLSLPDYTATFDSANSMAVSPDGRRLAYAWSAPPPRVSGTHVNGGIRLLNTVTGSLSTLSVPGGLGALCEAISWSPNGLWLAASCTLPDSYDAHGWGGSSTVERVRVATGRIEALTGPVSPSHLAVADDGSVVAASDGSIMGWGPTERGESSPVQSVRSAPSTVDWLGRSSLVLAGDLGRKLQVLVVAGDEYGDPRYIALGGYGAMTGSVGPNEVSLVVEREGAGELDTFSLRDGLVRRVVIEQMSHHTSYTFATDLLRSPTRATPAPQWPTDWSGRLVKAATYLVVGLSGTLVVLLVVVSVRRRRIATDA